MPSVKTMDYHYKDENIHLHITLNMSSEKVFYILLDNNNNEIKKINYFVNKNKIILKENQKNDNIEKIQYLLDIYNNINKTL